MLPVFAFKPEITSAVREHRVVIVTAETGAGKSTQVPQFLLDDEPGRRVVVTQPRCLAARSLALRVAAERGTPLGLGVGYRTAKESACRDDTPLVYVTDGLQLVRELCGGGGGGRTVLVIDEVHEFNLNVETLLAWAGRLLAAEPGLRLVLMSATIDAPRLAAFFGAPPVVSVPGKVFPVARRYERAREDPRAEVARRAADLARAGRRVLVFLPGKAEIAQCCAELGAALGDAAVVLPLHGELEPEEQARCFAPPPAGRTKVVLATNVAQTSVTIPDVDAVVDSGLERRIEVHGGVETLVLGATSRADCDQRAGRAGRVRPGEYWLVSAAPYEDRPAFPVPELLRCSLDQVVLRLADQGVDAAELRFYHEPPAEDARAAFHARLRESRDTLRRLGAFDEAAHALTPVGRAMARLPVSARCARMLVEAARLGVVEPVATIVACLEAGFRRPRGWRSVEADSDLLALLDLYRAACEMRGAARLKDEGIHAKSFYAARDNRRHILDACRQLPACGPPQLPRHYAAVRGSYSGVYERAVEESGQRPEGAPRALTDEEYAEVYRDVRESVATGPRVPILRACLAGLMDRFYVLNGRGEYDHPEDKGRKLDTASVLCSGGRHCEKPAVVAGFLFNLKSEYGMRTMLTNVSKVPRELLPFGEGKSYLWTPYGPTEERRLTLFGSCVSRPLDTRRVDFAAEKELAWKAAVYTAIMDINGDRCAGEASCVLGSYYRKNKAGYKAQMRKVLDDCDTAEEFIARLEECICDTSDSSN